MSEQEAWAAAIAEMSADERRVAHAWRTALADAREAAEVLREIWPSHSVALDGTAHELVPVALHAAEEAWAALERLDGALVSDVFAEARET